MHVRRVAGEQHATVAIRGRLPSRVGESREKADAVNAEVAAVDRDERLAKLVERWLVALLDGRLAQHGANAFAVLELAEGLDAFFAVADAERGLAGHFDFSDQVADGSVPAGEVDAGVLADQTATAVAADEIARA